MNNYERYRFQDFPWLDKDFDQAMEFLKEEKERQLGVYLPKKKITVEKLQALLELAQANGFLHALMLQGNDFGDEGCEVLSDFLSKDKQLRYLFLEENGITDKGLDAIIDGLRKNTTVKSIWLGRNEITDDGVEAFCNYLIEHQYIKEFSVGGKHMTNDGGFCVAKALYSNNKICSVHLLDNGIEYDGGKLLAEVASNHESCNTIEIHSSHLSAEAFSEMMKQMAVTEQKIAFEQAVLNGEEGPWLRSKIMVVGQGRAGKTATVRSMLNIPFDENLESTIGADISTSTTKKTEGNKWEKDDQASDKKVDLAVDAASRLAVLKIRKKKNDTKDALSKKSLLEMRDHFKMLKEEELKEIAKQRKANANVMPKDIQEEINQKFNATLVTNKNAHVEDIAFTIWDYGGQKVFYTLHHLFLTKYGLYILAFDMRDIIVPDAKEDEAGYRQIKQKRAESKEYLEFWLNSVYMHASEAPIMIVGTYMDVISEPSQIKEVNQFIIEIVDPRFKDVVVLNDALFFFPLSNKDCLASMAEIARSTGGKGIDGISNIDTIRDTIEVVARKQDFVNQNLSLRWIKCLDRMLQIDSSYIYYKDVIEIAKGCGIGDLKEVDNLLQFFHELGMIVHINSTQHLKEIVTIKPQWLITELAKVIRDKTLHHFDEKQLKKDGRLEMYKRVLDEAIVEKDWLEYLWPRERVGFLIDLMKRTMLISEWRFGGKEADYLVPSLLDKEDGKAMEEAARILVQFQKVEEDIETEIARLKKEGFFDEEANTKRAGRFGLGLIGARKKKAGKVKMVEVKELNELDDIENADEPFVPIDAAARIGAKDLNDKLEIKEGPKGFYANEVEVDSIVFDFTKSYLPNGVFQRLLCLCILKCTSDNKGAQKPKLFRSSAEIDMGNGQVFKIYNYNKQILCRVTKDHLSAYKVFQSMMEKMKTDVMGKGLEWDVYLETVDLKDKKKDEGVYHTFVLFNKVRDDLVMPWFGTSDRVREEAIVNKKVGIELEDFIKDISDF